MYQNNANLNENREQSAHNDVQTANDKQAEYLLREINGSQISMFDGSKKFKIDKPIRLIELFAGIGAQAKALERLGVPFEHYRVCEFDKYAIKDKSGGFEK